MRKMTLLVTVVALLAAAHFVGAQVDPGFKVYLYQDGVRVGEVFVEPGRAPVLEPRQTTVYREYWVLYPGYQYAGPPARRNPTAGPPAHGPGAAGSPYRLRDLVIKAEPVEIPYADLADFQRRVPFGRRYKYLEITATESLIPSGGAAPTTASPTNAPTGW